MKKQFLFIATVVFFSFGANAQKVNDKVMIESTGSWYNGVILKVDGDKYFVKYDDWDDSFNEWVAADRLKGFSTEEPKAPLTKFKVGDKVEVEYGMIPAPASVIEVGENKYHIKFDNSLYGDKWVTEKQIKKL
jgi:hypothetical protein